MVDRPTRTDVEAHPRRSHTPSALATRARGFFEQMQQEICGALEETDGTGKFASDLWVRPGGGGGATRVLEEGALFEKAGVNTSTVFGTMPEGAAKRLGVPPAAFFATGVSLVIHPLSPMIPTVHANYRYFEHGDGDAWFGGGSDLTPYYPFDEDIVHFHTILKRQCDRHGPRLYAGYKRQCDDYFFIAHRQETRGVGGIFFDSLRGEGEKNFAFVQSVAGAFLDSYLPIVRKRMHEPWSEHERAWQLHRRGRYVEFNLMYDRGTLFGLETQGRTESILMSLPPAVRWGYDVRPAPGSPEAHLMDLVTHNRDWAVE